MQPNFGTRELVNLNRFNAVAKTQFLGETLPAFSMETLPPIVTPSDAPQRVARIRALSRRNYARLREQVEAEFDERYGDLRPGPYPQTVPGDSGDEGYFG